MAKRFRNELDEMINACMPGLVNDKAFLENAFDYGDAIHISPETTYPLELLLNESSNTLEMVERFLQPGMKVLEIGGGVGLTYALLRTRGIDVVSLEPGADGFGDRHQAGMRLMSRLGIDPCGWIKTGIEAFDSDKRFDLVFSYYVLEHVSDLDITFKVMRRVLDTDGMMVHRCPNYTVPFEPHFNIPLIPLFPSSTACIYPKLNSSRLWKGLQFTSVGKISKLCSRHGLIPTFKRGQTASAFERLLVDPLFAARKKGLLVLAKGLRRTRLLNLLHLLPPAFDTPMEFSARNVRL
jgi:SAM-dependent methyltransferase